MTNNPICMSGARAFNMDFKTTCKPENRTSIVLVEYNEILWKARVDFKNTIFTGLDNIGLSVKFNASRSYSKFWRRAKNAPNF